MWIESSVEIGNRPIGLNVQRLDGAEREQAAVLLAWFTVETLASADGDSRPAWHDYAAEILRQHVSFVIADDQHPEQLDAAWWTEAAGRALAEFVRHNHLGPSISRHLDALRAMERRRRLES